MTIKQLANELDVSKQTISNVIAQLGLQGKIRRVGNRYMLSEIQVAQIKLKIAEYTPEKMQSLSEKSGKSPKMPKSQNAEDNPEKVQSLSEKSGKSPKTPKSQNAEDNSEKIQSLSEKSGKSPKTPKSQNAEDNSEKIQSSSEKSGKSPNEVLQWQLSMVDKQLAIKDSQIQMLQEQLATKDSQIRLLQEQLIAKDSQIGQITAAMESMATAFTATQALHAVTIQKQLTEHSAMDQLSDVEQPNQKQGFFWLFPKMCG